MAKLTRNSYKRKIILFGVFVFISIALISTGFAAWVMSSDAQDDATGNVNVGLVNDASLKIEITNKDALEGFTFQFEPAEGDNTGRVRLDKETPEIHEELTFTITGKISNPEILAENGLTIQMTLPAGMAKAIELNYIVAPECVAAPKAITVNENGEFTYTITFTWGAAFNSMNPSLYYDNDADGLLVSDADAKVALENLRACVYNYYDELTADGANRASVIESHKGDALPTYNVTLKAEAN